MPDAQNTTRFVGKEQYTLDEKGRVTIPKHWRLKGDKADKWHLVPESTGQCVRLMETWKFEDFIARAERDLVDDQAALRLFRNSFVGEAKEAEPDKQGRIAIPKEMCDAFALSGTIVMRGSGDLIEIWNKERLEAQLRAERERYLQVAARFGA